MDLEKQRETRSVRGVELDTAQRNEITAMSMNSHEDIQRKNFTMAIYSYMAKFVYVC